MKTKLAFALFLFLAISIEMSAQCPMCRMAAESNMENGGSAGQGLNAGILYMLALPYLLVAGIGYIWYRNQKTDIDHLESELQIKSREESTTSA